MKIGIWGVAVSFDEGLHHSLASTGGIFFAQTDPEKIKSRRKRQTLKMVRPLI
jgi:hypothetical protein